MEMKKINKIVGIACCCLLLSACKITSKNEATDQKEILKSDLAKQVEELELPDDIEAELYADNSVEEVVIEKTEKRMNISARDVDARVFFASLINSTENSVAIHPDVSGRITLNLKQVTLTETLRVIEDMFGYEIKKDGHVYHIYPAGIRVASFSLDYLFMNRMGGSRTSVLAGHLSSQDDDDNNDNSSGYSSSSSDSNKEFIGEFQTNNLNDGTEIVTVTSTNYWAYLELKINKLLQNKKGREVIVSPMSGLVTVRALPNEIREIREFLEKETEHLNRQVILEIQVIEVSLNNNYQQGISWTALATNASGTLASGATLGVKSTHKLASNIIQETIGGGAAFKLSNGNFEAVLSLLETQGDVNVLSKPRITAMNNQKAVIKVGGDEYFVTDISTTTVSGIDSTSPEVELTPFFSGISVDVTPKINNDDTVLLHIHPSIIEIEEQEKILEIGDLNLVLPLAKSNVRESDTIVKAKSGEVIIIGGLMKTTNLDVVSKVPLLGDIPWFGELFTNRNKVHNKTELVILVKPQIIKANTWKEEIEKSSDLIEKWYPSK